MWGTIVSVGLKIFTNEKVMQYIKLFGAYSAGRLAQRKSTKLRSLEEYRNVRERVDNVRSNRRYDLDRNGLTERLRSF